LPELHNECSGNNDKHIDMEATHYVMKPTNFDKDARDTAEEHWKWLESLLHKVYVDAMIHGIKHGAKDVEFKYESIAQKATDAIDSHPTI